MMKKVKDNEAFSKLEHIHDYPVASLDMHALTSLLFMLQRMNEKHSSTSHLAAAHAKRSKLRIVNIQDFFHKRWRYFGTHKLVNYLSSFEKVSIPVEFIFPCINKHYIPIHHRFTCHFFVWQNVVITSITCLSVN